MGKKLKLTLKEEHWYLAIKAAVLTLAWLSASAWIFFPTALLLFFYSAHESLTSYFRTWLLFIVAAYEIEFFFPEFSLLGAVAVFVGTFVLLGLRGLVLVHKKEIYRPLHFFILAAVFGLFFFADFFLNVGFWLFLLLGLAVYFLFRDLFVIFPVKGEEYKIFSIFSTLMVMEGVFVLRLLPIGVINQTAQALLFAVVLEEFIFLTAARKIKIGRILTITTMFVFAFLFIMAFSRWTVN